MRLQPQTYVLTAVAAARRRVFQRTVVAELMITTLLRYRDSGKFLLHGFVVMPDHVHIMVTPAESIEKTVQLIKGGFSFAVKKHYPGEVWQDGYHAHRIVDTLDYRNQLNYIACNPSKKGLNEYPYVHTSVPSQMDPAPEAFR